MLNGGIKNKINMTQEEKQLLLKDLCGRLPYKTYVKTENGVGYAYAINTSELIELSVANDSEYWSEVFNIDKIKPYLRPMSSMTEEEKKVLNGFAFDMGNKWFDATSNEEKWLATTENNIKSTDYLYSKYLDIHGLIEKGLALEAPEGMYKTE